MGGGGAALRAGAVGSDQPWDMQTSSSMSNKEIERAKETVAELVQTLLASTGAPAFVSAFGDDDDDYQLSSSYGRAPPFKQDQFVGFDPSKVPVELLTASSRALRTGRGQVLQDVMRQFELQAIAQDGMRGDDVDNGGGHYREVSKVRAFLDGYRRAEVRRVARETATLLLDKLVQEGIEGLDLALASMTRSGDDAGEYAGEELNDSLVDFLDDAVRQQEKTVEQLAAAERRDGLHSDNVDNANLGQDDDDTLDSLWNVEVEDGQRIETIDPKDPRVLKALRQETIRSESQSSLLVENSSRGSSAANNAVPQSPSGKLLLLLRLLRDRIRAEAAFAPDEKGRNLRLLAYCLQLGTDEEREQLILREIGNSMDVSDVLVFEWHGCGTIMSILWDCVSFVVIRRLLNDHLHRDWIPS